VLANRLPDGEPLPPAHERALERVLLLAKRAARGVEGEQLALVNFVGDFVRYDSSEEMSVAMALRRDAGGSLPATEHDDPVIAAVRALARDTFPALLLRATPRISWTAPGRRTRPGMQCSSSARRSCTPAQRSTTSS
jgi:hypothetical protein